MKYRKCPRCKETKSISEFSKHKGVKGGYSCWCRICKQKYHIEDCKKNPIRHWVRRTRNSHRIRGFQINFTIDDLVSVAKQTLRCPICDAKLGWEYGRGKIKDNSPTLDRINNDKILTLNNTQIVCHSCNSTKRNRTMKELAEWCKKFLKYYEDGKK